MKQQSEHCSDVWEGKLAVGKDLTHAAICNHALVQGQMNRIVSGFSRMNKKEKQLIQFGDDNNLDVFASTPISPWHSDWSPAHFVSCNSNMINADFRSI